jgi:predicted metal-dependent hydrolase
MAWVNQEAVFRKMVLFGKAPTQSKHRKNLATQPLHRTTLPYQYLNIPLPSILTPHMPRDARIDHPSLGIAHTHLVVEYRPSKNRQTMEMRWHPTCPVSDIPLEQLKALLDAVAHRPLAVDSLSTTAPSLPPSHERPPLWLEVRCGVQWLTPLRRNARQDATQSLIQRVIRQTYRRRVKQQQMTTLCHRLETHAPETLQRFESPTALATWVAEVNARTLQHPHYRGMRLGYATKTRIAQINVRTGVMTLSKHVLPAMGIPEALLYYLVIHELCHLVHANHSKAFWALVARYCPEYRHSRQALKTFFATVVNQQLPLMFEV